MSSPPTARNSSPGTSRRTTSLGTLGLALPGWQALAYLLSISDSERQPRVMVRDLDGGKFATSIDVNAMYLLWAPDGRSLVATSYVTEIWEPLKVEHVRIDLVNRTSLQTRLAGRHPPGGLVGRRQDGGLRPPGQPARPGSWG